LTHQRGYWLISTSLRQAGFEVILGGIQVPKEIVATAVQEDVDIIGYHIMGGPIDKTWMGEAYQRVTLARASDPWQHRLEGDRLISGGAKWTKTKR
jgi:hypothetical protein